MEVTQIISSPVLNIIEEHSDIVVTVSEREILLGTVLSWKTLAIKISIGEKSLFLVHAFSLGPKP